MGLASGLLHTFVSLIGDLGVSEMVDLLQWTRFRILEGDRVTSG